MKKNIIKIPAYIILLSCTCFNNVFAEVVNEANIHQKLIQSISEKLSNNYVFPEAGIKYKKRLTQCLKENCLQGESSKSSVAHRLTELLQSVHEDKHLNIFAPGHEQKMTKKRVKKIKKATAANGSDTGIVEQKVLANNIGYLKINRFPGSSESIAAINQAMINMKDTKAIVFDIREHRGGSPEEISVISNYLFQSATHMVTTRSPYVNNGQPVPHMSQPNKYAKFFKDKPIYLLISKKSGSAAEHFAMSMKATGRAILVGGKTGGYGHWGEIVDLVDGFSMFVPSGRTYHPVNKLGWEGIGITPDIMADEADSLNVVFKLIDTHY